MASDKDKLPNESSNGDKKANIVTKYTLNKGKQSILSMEEKGPNFSHPTSHKEIRPKPGLENKARYHPDIGRAFQANVTFEMTQ